MTDSLNNNFMIMNLFFQLLEIFLLFAFLDPTSVIMLVTILNLI